MCDCPDSIDIGSYEACVPVNPPSHMKDYINQRIKKGLNKDGKIYIDKCIVEEIQYLWSLGVTTYGCCCGHNKSVPMVNIDEKDTTKMLKLGYKGQKGTFQLKTH